jgi:hypothetical protein
METPVKKVLFFSNQGLSTLHLGIEMEVIEDLILQNINVYYSNCDKVTKSCYFNPTGNPIGCGICQGRNVSLHKLIKSENLIHVQFPKVNIEPIVSNYNVNENSEIVNWQYDGINIGRGILSSVISLRRDYEVYNEKVYPLISEELKVSLRVLTGFIQLVKEVNPDEVYVFNGRFSETFPIISYCKNSGLPFSTMELGATNQKYEIFRNTLPHSIESRQKNMKLLWEKMGPGKYEAAENWFSQKISGTNTDDKVYTKHQNKELLPENFNTSKINISIFNSSEDEMKTIDEWQHDLFDTQNEAIRKIVTNYLHDDKYHFYLRVHPNLSNVNNSQVKEIAEFTFPNLTIIEADNPIDTYFLMVKSDLVISFGSTIGIEATFHGKISISLGKSFYSGMDAAYEPKSFDELYLLIASLENLQPKPKQNTYLYANYILNRGNDYKYFKYKNKFDSAYRGIKLKRFYFISIFMSLLYFREFIFYTKKFKILYKRFPKITDLKKLRINSDVFN